MYENRILLIKLFLFSFENNTLNSNYLTDFMDLPLQTPCSSIRWSISVSGRKLMVDFVVVLSDLHPYVLDTWVKRRVELSTDLHLVFNWIWWRPLYLKCD